MATRFPDNFEIPFGGEYVPAIPPVGQSRPRPCIIQGRNVWLRPEGYSESWMGMLATTTNMTAGFIMPLANDGLPGGIGSGTVLVYRADSTAFIGSGNVYRNGAALAGAPTASSALQLLLNGTLITVGLSAPPSPVLYLLPVASGGKCRGNYSGKLTQTRTADGEESNASVVSNVVTADPAGQKLIISLDGIATPSDGKSWNYYGTDGGSSQLGPWYFRFSFNSSQLGMNTDKDGQSRPNSIVFDYYNFEQNNVLAPFDFAPPPVGTHLTTLGSVMIVLGSYGPGGSPPGAGVSPSKVQQLAWPASYTRFLNPAAPIVRVDGRPGQGWQAVWTKHSLQAILLSGDDTGPVFVRGIWPRIGILSGNGACMLENGEIYAFSADGFPVRSSGSPVPDAGFLNWRSWASRVRPDLKAIDPNFVAVGHHQQEDAIIFFDGVNATAQPYLRSEDRWCPKFDLAQGNVLACAEVLGKLYCNIGGTLYTFDKGGGSGINWNVYPADYDMGTSRRKTVWGWKGSVRGKVKRQLFGNLDHSTVLETEDQTASISALDRHTDFVGTNVADLGSFTIGASGTTGGARAYAVEVDGVIEDEKWINL